MQFDTVLLPYMNAYGWDRYMLDAANHSLHQNVLRCIHISSHSFITKGTLVHFRFSGIMKSTARATGLCCEMFIHQNQHTESRSKFGCNQFWQRCSQRQSKSKFGCDQIWRYNQLNRNWRNRNNNQYCICSINNQAWCQN